MSLTPGVSLTNDEKCHEKWQKRLCVAMREFQNDTSCSTRHLSKLLTKISPFLANKAPNSIKMADKEIQFEAGAKYEKLHGCVNSNCAGYVFGPENKDKTHCPLCRHERVLGADGAEPETVYYFPLRPRLEALLSTTQYRESLKYERKRNHNSVFYTDVYDSPGNKTGLFLIRTRLNNYH